MKHVGDYRICLPHSLQITFSTSEEESGGVILMKVREDYLVAPPASSLKPNEAGEEEVWLGWTQMVV